MPQSSQRRRSALKRTLLLTALLLTGCALDVREQRLRQAVDTVEPVLRRPELIRLAGEATPAKLVKAFYSEEGRTLWPPAAPSQVSYEAPFPAGSLPPRIVLTRINDLPWSVVVKAEGEALVVEGYGESVSIPLLVRRLTPGAGGGSPR